MIPVLYMAHPAGASTPEEHRENLARARRWFSWIARQGFAVVADWIIYCEVWDDFDATERELGLQHDDATIPKCDVYGMVGGRISPGMKRGLHIAQAANLRIIDWTPLGLEPPPRA